MKLTTLVFFLGWEQERPFRQFALNNNSDVPGASSGGHGASRAVLGGTNPQWHHCKASSGSCSADIQCKSSKMRQHHAQLNSISSPIPTLCQRRYNLNLRGKSAVLATKLCTPTSTPNFSLSYLFYLFFQPSHTRWSLTEI